MVFNAGGSGRVWPPGGGRRSIGWPNGWTEKNATWPNGWKTKTATWSPPSNWRVRGSDGRMAQCAWMSYKRAGSILNWSGHGSVRFSIVQSLDCLRTAGSVRFLFFFFFPPPIPREARGRVVARSVSIGGPRALSLVNRSWVRTMSGRRSCGTRSPWRRRKGERVGSDRGSRWTGNEARLNARSAIDEPKERTRTRGGIPGDRLAASASGSRSARAHL